MSAIGISSSCRLAPSIISAHADHRRSDFVFSRTQSLMLREAPWEHRLKPLRTWSEIGAYGAAALTATVLVTVLI